jgi:hypothetical protein
VEYVRINAKWISIVNKHLIIIAGLFRFNAGYYVCPFICIPSTTLVVIIVFEELQQKLDALIDVLG